MDNSDSRVGTLRPGAAVSHDTVSSFTPGSVTARVTEARLINESAMNQHTLYAIEVRYSPGFFSHLTGEKHVFEGRTERRFNEFKLLHSALKTEFQSSIVPALPPDKINKTNEEVVRARKAMLGRYLNKIAGHPVLSRSEPFRVFLTGTPSEMANLASGSAAPTSETLYRIFTNFSLGSMFSGVVTPKVEFKQSDDYEKFRAYAVTQSERLNELAGALQSLESQRVSLGDALEAVGDRMCALSAGEPIAPLAKVLSEIGDVTKSLGENERRHAESGRNFAMFVNECSGLMASIQDVLKNGDMLRHKYQEADAILNQANTDRRLIAENQSNGTGSQDPSRGNALNELDSKIPTYQNDRERARQNVDRFMEQILAEHMVFQTEKLRDHHRELKSFLDLQRAHHERMRTAAAAITSTLEEIAEPFNFEIKQPSFAFTH